MGSLWAYALIAKDLHRTQPNRLLEVPQPQIEKECAAGTRKALGDRYRGHWFTHAGRVQTAPRTPALPVMVNDAAIAVQRTFTSDRRSSMALEWGAQTQKDLGRSRTWVATWLRIRLVLMGAT
jgi:hypothetical protein